MYGSPFDDYRPYDRPAQRHPDAEERLRHVVFLDGRLIDSWTEPVELTAYRDWAQELDRAATPRSYPARPPTPLPHEEVLSWLDGVVGGRSALLALDDRPLVAAEAPDDAGDVYAEAATLLHRVCTRLFADDAEFEHATQSALTALWRKDRELTKGHPGEVVGGLCWMVGRANGCVGAGTSVTQQTLKQELWITTSLSTRANKYKERLRDLFAPPGRRPASCPNLLEVGDAALLTSSTRRELVGLRDRALEAAAQVAADRQAREEVVARGNPSTSLT